MARPADPNARTALVAAARAEFVRRGLKGARIEDITSASGLSKGAFYLHFPSKDALFGELVAQLTQGMDALAAERLAALEGFLRTHGPVSPAQARAGGPHYAALVELEGALDERVLALIWDFRDVVHVLVRGAAGTPFESVVWEVVEREVERIERDCLRLAPVVPVRPDVPLRLFAQTLVGTYLLVGQQMGQLAERPDLGALARNIHRLVREGTLPAVPAARPPAAVHPDTPSRRPRLTAGRPNPKSRRTKRS